MLGVSFGIPGGAWVALMEPMGAYENIKKPMVFVVFLAFGGSWEGIGDPSGTLGAALGRLGGSWGGPGRSLGGPWGSLEDP